MSTKTKKTKEATNGQAANRLLTGTGRSGVDEQVAIPPPNFKTAAFKVVGLSAYVQHKFGAKARAEMLQAQMSTAKKGSSAKKPRDPAEDYQQAQHLTAKGENGIPAPAFRNAMISACRVAGFVMAKAKLAVFIEADGFDVDDQTPMVFFTKGKPHVHEGSVRLASGVASLAFRPMWDPGWELNLRVRWDADQFTLTDVSNLLHRAGLQVGVGEGRPDSKKSNGMGWGTFSISQ
jgi:hypothetical protein